MKRIIRLTESDLARIVRRVINEAETAGPQKPPMIDGGVRASGGDVLIALSEPVAVAGSGFRGVPTVQVKFKGLELNRNGERIRSGNIVAYGICGTINYGGSDGAMNYNPASLGLDGSSEVAAGNNFNFNNNSPVGAAARNFCASKGVKDLAPGITFDAKSMAQKVYNSYKG